MAFRKSDRDQVVDFLGGDFQQPVIERKDGTRYTCDCSELNLMDYRHQEPTNYRELTEEQYNGITQRPR